MSINVSVDGYTLLNQSPAVALVSSERINNAIAAQFFHPERVKALLLIEKSEIKTKILSCLANRKRNRISAQKLKDIGYPFVGLADIDSSTGFITPSSADSINGTSILFKSGDILYSKLRPYLNKVAMCPDSLKYAAGSTELVVYTSKKGINRWYLFAVLKSNIVLNQLIKITSGSTHPRVDPDFIDSAEIPLPDPKTQEYIGQKVALAEKCREEANRCENEAINIFNDHWEPSDVALSGSFITTTEIDVLDNDRLDPEFYRNDLLSMKNKIIKNKSGYVRIGKYGESFSGKTPSDKGDDESLCEIVRVANLTSRGLNWSNRLFGTLSKSSKGLLKDGDIIVCKDAHQKYYIGQQVDIFCRPNHYAVASSETLVIRLKRTHINPFAALVYLRSKEGYAAFQQQIRGTSAHLYPTDVEKIVIPKIPEEAEIRIERLIRRAEHCRIKAFIFTDEAKSDVESLIESKLDIEAILSGKLKPLTWEEIEKELEGF